MSTTMTGAFDALPQTAATATTSWWRALTELVVAKLSARHEAYALREHAHQLMHEDRRLAADLCAAADMHELRRGDR